MNRREAITGLLASAAVLPVLPAVADSPGMVCFNHHPVMCGPRLATVADLIPGAVVELSFDGANWHIDRQLTTVPYEAGED